MNVTEVISDKFGRFLIIQDKLYTEYLNLVNIYAPNMMTQIFSITYF